MSEALQRIEAVLYRYRAGIPWRNLPERFGDGKNEHMMIDAIMGALTLPARSRIFHAKKFKPPVD
jgi:transposase